MISLLPLLLTVQIYAVGVEAGTAIYIPETGFGFQAGMFYAHNISEAFWISSGISYWAKKYRKQEGIVERDCFFSDLFLHEEGLMAIRLFDRLRVGAGAGISVHLLKNDAKERRDYGSFTVTDYRTKTMNRLGLQVHLLAELKVRRCFVTLKGGYTTLLMDSNQENLFYEVGNVRIFSITVGIGLDLDRP